MKKVILAAINARYFHSNLAVRCLKETAGKNHNIEIVERTINDTVDAITRQIALKNPDSVGFSCYIWNIDKVLKVADDLKKILPDCFIFLGGPEASYDAVSILEGNASLDMIIRGEGEITFKKWLDAFEDNRDFSKLNGTTQRIESDILHNQDCNERFNLDQFPFLYDDLLEFENKIIYFETSRGCPFKCSYCISSIADSMSYMSIDKVLYAFEYFMKNNVQQVKLVDRTFNFPIDRANEILRGLVQLKKKCAEPQTNFHFEITATLVDAEMIEILSKAEKGLIQLEIGIQSTNKKTLDAINRTQDNDALFDSINAIVSHGNIAVNVDLIAGLPHESYEQFKTSFNETYALNTNKIHLGFLKALKGSDIRANADKYGLVYSNTAPYKVFKTNDISYKQLVSLDKIEQTLETYRNTNHFKNTLLYIIHQFEAPFEFFEQYSLFLDERKHFRNPQKLTKLFDLLYDFLNKNYNFDIDELKMKMQLDWLLIDRPRSFPEHLKMQYTDAQKKIVRLFYNDKENISKYLPAYIQDSPSAISRKCFLALWESSNTCILFDYGRNGDNTVREIHINEQF